MFCKSVQSSKISPDAAPTRLLLKGAELCGQEATDVPGLPTHKAVIVTIKVPEKREATGWRTTRTAVYAATGKQTSQEDREAMQRAVKATKAEEAEDPRLEIQWQSWHAKAEAVLKCAVLRGLATNEVKAERDKGAPPSQKPKARKKRRGPTKVCKWRR